MSSVFFENTASVAPCPRKTGFDCTPARQLEKLEDVHAVALLPDAETIAREIISQYTVLELCRTGMTAISTTSQMPSL